jgi:hypothetical protein
LKAVTGWIARHRRRPGARPAQRAGTVHTQVALALRWLGHRLDLRTLAGESGVGITTAHRYLHEALDEFAACTPCLDDVLRAPLPFVCLNSTPLSTRPTRRRSLRLALIATTDSPGAAATTTTPEWLDRRRSAAPP